MAVKDMDSRKTSRAVFHVTESGNSVYFRVNRPLELLDAAAGACAHNTMKKDAPWLRFRDYYADTEPCTKADFERAVSERMENTGAVSGAFEIDFDRGEFSALHIMDGWKTFRMEDVCRAMRKVSETGGLDRDKLYRVLTDQLDGKELRYDPPPLPTCSVLHVTSRGESHYTRTDAPLTFLEIAEGLRRYLGMSTKDRPPSFGLYYSGVMTTPTIFDEYVSDFLNKRSDAAGVYDVNLDTGYFSVLRAGQGWERYSTNDVCHAAWTASHELAPEARPERFDAEIAHSKSLRIPPPVFDHAVTVAGNELRLAVFHVSEKQAETWFSLPGPLESVYAATALRNYLLRQPGHQAEMFSGYYQEACAMSKNDYEWYTANLLGRGDIVTQVYDLDLDAGVFSVLHKNGWRNYPVSVVCDAAHQASNLTRFSPIPESRRFLDRISGQEIRRDDLEICIRGDRRLDPGEISFSDEVVQMERLLNFYIDVCFLPDVVLGTYVCTDENDDYVNVYANYDLERGTLCDALDVTLWRGDDSFVELKYRLSPEEKEMLLPRMEEYCRQQTGMTLGEWREQYRQETAAEFRQDAPAQGMEPQM